VTLPAQGGADRLLQNRLASEKWRRFFPPVPYYQIKKAVTYVTNRPSDALVGETATTKFDPVYGEAIDPTAGSTWQQPHGSDVLHAADPEVYAASVLVNLRVQIEATDTDLKLWGFERMEDAIASCPNSLLSQLGVTCKSGDYFVWGGHEYEVLQAVQSARFDNEPGTLYNVLNCKIKRRGS
jgi:hypothetical protein